MHPDPSTPVRDITAAYSLECGVKDISALVAAAPRILQGSTLSIPDLANQDDDARLAAVRAVRAPRLRAHAAPVCAPCGLAGRAGFVRQARRRRGRRRALLRDRWRYVAPERAVPRQFRPNRNGRVRALGHSGCRRGWPSARPSGHEHVRSMASARTQVPRHRAARHGAPDRHAVRLRCGCRVDLVEGAARAGHRASRARRRAGSRERRRACALRRLVWRQRERIDVVQVRSVDRQAVGNGGARPSCRSAGQRPDARPMDR